MTLINTHTAVKKFIKHGFTEEQAEVMVEVINDQNTNLATKTDLLQVKSALKNDIKVLEVALKTELNWIKAALFGIIGLLIKLTFFN